jgi:pyruvate,water dikinase
MSTIAPPNLQLVRFFGPGVAEEKPSKEVLGGKGYSLMAMTRAGLPVPPGFIIPTACCAEYYAAGRKWPAGLEDEVRQALEWLEELTGRKLGQAPRPLTVAVRSGAAVSMPGMMDTVLNVGLRPELERAWGDPGAFWSDYHDFIRHYGETVCGIDEKEFDPPAGATETPADAARRCRAVFERRAGRPFPSDPWEMLATSISAVFGSWENDRAVRYRAHHNIRGLAGTAAVVQAMFPSQRSGILFTEDPNRPDEGRILVEASTGLGEAIVRGQVEPDVYCVDRGSLEIRERKLAGGSVACLSDAQVLELTRLGLEVEKFFGTPVDVEWGIADGRAVLLQSRPVRGLDTIRRVPKVREDEIRRLRHRAAGRPRAAWAVHNLSETLPAPTPLTWDVIGRGFMAHGFIDLYRELGFVPSDRVRREGFLELVAGRVYTDLERAAELFFGDFPMEYDVRSDGRAAEMLLDRPTKFNVERAGLGFLLRLPWTVVRMVRAGRVLKRALRTGLDDLQGRVLPAFAAAVERARSRNLAALPDEALLAELAERERLLDDFGRESLKPGFLAGYHHGRLASTLEQALGPAEGRALTARLLAGLEGDKTVESNVALYRVAKGELALEAYLAEFGHRAVNELELAEPRWSEDPSYPRQRIEQYRRAGGASPLELHEKKKKERLEAELALGKVLAENGASSLEGDVRADLAGAQRHLPWRETCKHHFIRAVALVREVTQVLGERWDLGRDVYFLERGELALFRADRARFLEAIGERKTRWQAFQRMPVPEILRAGDLEAIGREEERPAFGDGVFTGTGVASGVGSGAARLLRSPSEAGDLSSGYVLVCPTTDPSWTPLFVHAAGLVVERGGMLSHGAIVARDFGIPAVVLPQATRLIPDGAVVRIDGNKGRVEILRQG